MIYEYGLFNEFKIISEIQYERFKDDLIYLENDEVYLLNVNKYNFINKVSCYVVNATFACEIALKGLLRLNQNIIHIYDQKVMKSHRLDDLFDFLLVEQQEFILKELPLLTTIEDLKQELKIVGNNFSEWRSSFQVFKANGEDNNLKTNIFFIKDFLNALDKLLT